MQMDERKKKVLEAIVLDYIATAEPVGSRTIARKFDLGVSSATIRNEMADLEELGLIEQPHTSAGRVPSDAGYRFYVDWMMQKESLNEAQKQLIYNNLYQRIKEIEDLAQGTSHLISKLTNLASVVLTTNSGNNAFGQVHLLPYQPGTALMVVIKENGAVENHVVDVGESITPDDLQRVSAILNTKLKGLTIDQLKSGLLAEIYSELTKQKTLISLALDIIEPILDAKDDDMVVLGGAVNMLNQPEFKNVQKLKSILKVFEETQALKRALTQDISEGLTVRIGGENKLEEMHDCSLVTATYQVDGRIVGAIGVLGPTRMDYAKTVGLLEFMTQGISTVLERHHKR